MQHIVNPIYRGDLHNLVINEAVIEAADIGFFDLPKPLFPKGWFDKDLIHIDIVFHGAVLDASFHLPPKVKHIVNGDGFDIRLDPVMAVNGNLKLLLAKIVQGLGINGMALSDIVRPAICIAAAFLF